MPLSDVAIRSAKPRAKPYKITDGGGLYLLVQPNGSRLWNLAYRYGGKQKKLSFGAYPVVGLADARSRMFEAKKALGLGDDPAAKKKLERIAKNIAVENTFKILGEEWFERIKAEGAAARTLDKKRWLLNMAYPAIGSRPVSEITPPEVYDLLQRVERSGRLETARRLRMLCSDVFRYAIRTARAVQDPCGPLKGATAAPQVTHHAAIFEPARIGGLMRAIDGYDGCLSARTAVRFMAYTFIRTEELRFAVKSEFDLDGALWSIPAERMKMNRPHLVPLARQVVTLLREVFEITTCDLVFPSVRSPKRPISENTVNASLRAMGYASADMCGHGFRRMASTILNEQGYEPDWIERQLAHKDKDRVRGSYNAAEYLAGRTEMMQWWADYLDRLAVDEDDLIG